MIAYGIGCVAIAVEHFILRSPCNIVYNSDVVEIHVLRLDTEQPWVVAANAVGWRRLHCVVVYHTVAHDELHIVCQHRRCNGRPRIGYVVLDDAVVHLHMGTVVKQDTATTVHSSIVGSLTASDSHSVEGDIGSSCHTHRVVRIAVERANRIVSVKLSAVVLNVAVIICRLGNVVCRGITTHNAQRTLCARYTVRHGIGIVVVVRVFGMDIALAQAHLEDSVVVDFETRLTGV